MHALATPQVSIGRQGWNFARHFIEMCISMCAGGYVLYVLIFAGLPAAIGSPDLRAQLPELSLVVTAIVMTLPMAAWMRFRGMEWRPTLEMSAVPLALAVAMIGLVSLRVLSEGTLQVEFGRLCGMACIGMLGVMFFRLDLYTGRTGHHTAAGTHAAHAA